jgi:hypothetical protein
MPGALKITFSFAAPAGGTGVHAEFSYKTNAKPATGFSGKQGQDGQTWGLTEQAALVNYGHTGELKGKGAAGVAAESFPGVTAPAVWSRTFPPLCASSPGRPCGVFSTRKGLSHRAGFPEAWRIGGRRGRLTSFFRFAGQVSLEPIAERAGGYWSCAATAVRCGAAQAGTRCAEGRLTAHAGVKGPARRSFEPERKALTGCLAAVLLPRGERGKGRLPLRRSGPPLRTAVRPVRGDRSDRRGRSRARAVAALDASARPPMPVAANSHSGHRVRRPASIGASGHADRSLCQPRLAEVHR